MTTTDFIANIESSYVQCLRIIVAKNADYAGKDDPFKNFMNSLTVGVDPQQAILVRVMDKISRIANLLHKEAEVSDETVTDTILDAINYLAILKALHNEVRNGRQLGSNQ